MKRVFFLPTEEEIEEMLDVNVEVIALYKNRLGTDDVKTAYALVNLLLGFQDATTINMKDMIKQVDLQSSPLK